MTQEFRAPARFGLLGLLIALSVLVIGCNRQVAMPAQGDKPAGEPTSTASKLSEPTITPTAAPAPAVTETPTYTMVTISSTRPPLDRRGIRHRFDHGTDLEQRRDVRSGRGL